MANITDLSYPVGKETNVSLPDTNDSIVSSCLGFNPYTEMPDPEPKEGPYHHSQPS